MKTFIQKLRAWFKRRNLLSKIGLITLMIIFLLLFFANTIAKMYINANGEDLSGRKLHLSSLHFNYLKCSVSLGDFVMYESNKSDTFVYLGSGYVNMSPWSLMDDEIEFSAIALDRLRVELSQKDGTFNFDDLGGESETPEDTTSAPTKYLLENVQLTNGNIVYRDHDLEQVYPVQDLNINVPKLTWNGNNTGMNVRFHLEDRGDVNIVAGLNNKTNGYQVGVKLRNLDMNYAEVYLKDLFNIRSLNGRLHSDVALRGSLENVMAITCKGNTSIADFEIIDKWGNPFTKMDSAHVVVDSINLDAFHFHFSETYLKSPVAYMHLKKDGSTNIDAVLKPVMGGSSPDKVDTTLVAEEAPKPAEETPFFFEISKARIAGGQVHFKDDSPDRPFSTTISNLAVTTTNISDQSRNMKTDFSMIVGQSGRISGSNTLDLVDANNISFDAVIEELELLPFSPYSEYYAAAPITQGSFNYDVDLQMSATELVNNNHFDIRELEFGKKLKDADSAYKVPIKLAMVLLKDKNDNIQFEIPVVGNPSDPDFKLFPIIWKTFKKFLGKAASSPIRAISSLVGSNPEDIEIIAFEFGDDAIGEHQKKSLDKIVELCEKKPQLIYSFVQMTDEGGEKLRIALMEAKKQFRSEDSESVGDNDAEFRDFLMQKTGMDSRTPTAKMAIKLIGEQTLAQRLNSLISSRNASLKNHLLSKGLTEQQFKVSTADLQNLPQELKKPQFKVEVSID